MSAEPTASEQEKAPRHFIQQILDADLAAGKNEGRVHTRFPPEPNGYLHIGHAKSICLNSGLAREFGGKFNLRFDDTNPAKEEQEYVDAIMDDVRWLGADWEDRLCFSSDYFDQLYDWAVQVDQSWQGVCLRSRCRGDAGVPRFADRARKELADARSHGRRKTSTCSHA